MFILTSFTQNHMRLCNKVLILFKQTFEQSQVRKLNSYIFMPSSTSTSFGKSFFFFFFFVIKTKKEQKSKKIGIKKQKSNEKEIIYLKIILELG